MGEVSEAQDSVLIPSNRDVFIYLYSHPSTGEPVYVGKTFSVKERKKQHLYDAKRQKRKTKFNLWLNSYREVEPVIIEVCSLINWEDREKFWIDYFRNINENLLNTLDGGEGFNHFRFDGEYKKKLSEAAKAKYRKNPYLRELIVEKLGKIERLQLPDVFSDYHEKNIPICRLCQKYNISRSTIGGILSGRRYKHLTGFLLYKYGKPTERASTRNKKKVVDMVCRDYLDGRPIEDLMSRYKCHRHTIFEYIKTGTGKTFQKHEKDKLRGKILLLYNRGELSNKMIADIVGVHLALVYQVISKQKKCDGKK